MVLSLVVQLFWVGVLATPEETRDPEKLFLSNTRQVTFEGMRAGEGYFSSDGSKLVFQSERDPDNPFFQIFLLDLETGDTKRVSPGFGKTTCSWIHPDGTRVLFASTHADPNARLKQQEELEKRESGEERRYSWDYDEFYDLYEADPNTGDLRRLTSELGYDAEGSWSPDGSLIAFSSNRHAYQGQLTAVEKEILKEDLSYFVDIYLMNADGTNLRRLTDVPGYDGGPFFSRDGRKICWRRFSEDGATADIFTMNLDGSDQKQITRLDSMSWAPFFHPSGDYLVFTTNLHGFANFELYIVDAGGSKEPVRVTSTEGFDGLPAFSPDGKLLAWTSNRTPSGQSQLFFAEWNDAAARKQLGIRQTSPEISASDLGLYVARLTSPEMEGRLTGSVGARLAAEYGALVFQDLGLQPAGDGGSFFQKFEFTAGVSLGPKNELALHGGDEQVTKEPVDEVWRPLAYSRTGDFEKSELVFAGYGIVAPAEESHPEYDSYVHLDVTDKWVLMYRYLPEEVSAERRQHLSRYSSLRYKAMAARDRGALGIIVMSGPNSQVKEELVELSFDASLGGTSVAVLSIADRLGQKLMSAAGKDLKELQDELDSGEPFMGFSIPGVKLSAKVDVQQEKKTCQNVLARLPAGAPSSASAVVVGAHLDHLGRGIGMTTLARAEEKGEIHFGADDNASGVAGVLEIAEYLAHQKDAGRLDQKRDVIFALWSGEELGLLGSNHYTESLDEETPAESDISQRIAAYLNLDMIGRLREDLVLQGVGSSSTWKTEIERRNAPIGLSITPQNDSYLPTDSTSFYMKKVPVLSAFTGVHEEYHSPRDLPDTLNYGGMEKVARFMSLTAASLAGSENAPDYQRMKQPSQSAGRTRMRVYLGTIPDYAQGAVAGVQLSGVIGGGPAEQAGLQGGDIIVELAGRRIENIYDYTYAIDALKIGEPATIVVLRKGERLSIEITPGSRE
jgi:Tol biopolymer transport system component